MSKISIVILNWNGEKFLKKFLPKVVGNSSVDGHEVDVVVADNGSTDGSVGWLNSEYPNLRTIILDKNHGFAGGYNLALEQVSSDYYLLLNSDVDVPEGWLVPLVQFMESNQNVAACQPKILSFNEPNRFEYAGASGGFVDFLGYPFCRGRILNVTEVDEGQYNDACEVFWASGACMLIRSTDFWSVGGFDSDFFAHMEEIDLCWRLKNKGRSVWVVPQSKVFHVGGGTLPNNNPFKVFLNHRNNLFMLLKNLPKRKILPVVIFRIVLDIISAVMYLLSGKFGFFAAVFKAHRAFFANYRKTFDKRLNVLATQNYLYQRSILFCFFLLRKQKFSKLS